MFWAMAKVAPLSLAVATFRPVLMWVWVACSSLSVLLRYCNAIIAPLLVFTLSIMVLLCRSSGRCNTQAPCLQSAGQLRGARKTLLQKGVFAAPRHASRKNLPPGRNSPGRICRLQKQRAGHVGPAL